MATRWQVLRLVFMLLSAVGCGRDEPVTPLPPPRTGSFSGSEVGGRRETIEVHGETATLTTINGTTISMKRDAAGTYKGGSFTAGYYTARPIGSNAAKYCGEGYVIRKGR